MLTPAASKATQNTSSQPRTRNNNATLPSKDDPTSDVTDIDSAQKYLASKNIYSVENFENKPLSASVLGSILWSLLDSDNGKKLNRLPS